MTTMLHRFFGRSQSSPTSMPVRDARKAAIRGGAAETVHEGLPSRVDNPAELPSWSRNRTAAGGDLPMNQQDRRVAAVLDCGKDGHLILFSPSASTGRVLAGLESRLSAMGVKYTRCATTAEVLEIVYDNISAPTSAVESTVDLGDGAMAPLLDSLLLKAIDLNASDIHIEVGPSRTCILMRVHGDLQVVRHLSLLKGTALSRHIFVNANSSGVDFKPEHFQDAKISKSLLVEGKQVNLELRFADMPTYPLGHDVTLRVLRSGAGTAQSIDSLGYDEAQQVAIDRMLNTSTGLIVMCGATGSGKSTTLGAIIQTLADRHGGRKKIRSIEDPPELILPARQTPIVRDSDGTSRGFAAALRGAMRGDPDIIMIGEVRDNETGELAMDATMTGHKVMTTVHGGSVFDAVDRLIKKGFDRSVLFAEGTLCGVIYQTLLPLLCQECCVPLSHVRLSLQNGLTERLRRSYSGDLEDLRFRGPGCEACNFSPIVGRTVAAAFLVPDRNLRQLLLNNDRFAAEEYWRTHDWAGIHAANGKTVLDQALKKMAMGLISPVDIETKVAPIDSQADREPTRFGSVARAVG